jgi:hypothetical protein
VLSLRSATTAPILEQLSRKDRHSKELRQVVAYPRQWIRQLQLDGEHIDETSSEDQDMVHLKPA